MAEPDDFDELAREFQRIDVDDRAHVAARFVRARRRAYGEVAVAASIVVGLATIAIRKLWLDRDAPAIAFAVLEIGAPVFLLVALLREQRRLWRSTIETVRGFLELEIARMSSEIRLTKLLARVAPLLALGVLVFQILVLQKTSARVFDSPIAAAAGFAGPYVILALVLLFNRRKEARATRKRAAFEAELRRLTEEEERP